MDNMNKKPENDVVLVKKNNKISILAFLGCFLLACIIWVNVMNTTINDNRKTFTIKMDIRGESELLSEKNYSIFTASETLVKVTVQGTAADLNKCSEKDFGVYVDVSDIENSGTTQLNIVVESNNGAVSIVSTDPMQMTVFADEKVNDMIIPLSMVVSDGVDLEANLQMRLGKEVLSISGPKTYLSKVDRAQITVPSLDFRNGGERGAYFVDFPVEFYDVAGNLISSPYITYNATDISLIIEPNQVAPDTTITE